MTEPDLEGRGASSASRRRFLWLGGSLAAGLLLFPDFSFAAKAAKKVAGTSGGKDGSRSVRGSATTKSARQSSKRAVESGAPVKRTASGKTSYPVTSSARKEAPKRAVAKTSRRTSVATSSRGKAPSGTRSAVGTQTSRLELPSSYSPGRAFSFGGGSSDVRDLSLYCVHTGERLDIEYYVNGNYEREALRAVDHLLRDYHTDEVCQFDPRVLNQLHDLRRALGSREAFRVYSGYRSPATNESYRRAGARVAEHSYHLTGQAIDISLPGRDVRQLRNVAIAMRAGGVGYYPSDGFLHVDTGPVRRW